VLADPEELVEEGGNTEGKAFWPSDDDMSAKHVTEKVVHGNSKLRTDLEQASLEREDILCAAQHRMRVSRL
jgi:hypothetical protein